MYMIPSELPVEVCILELSEDWLTTSPVMVDEVMANQGGKMAITDGNMATAGSNLSP